MWADMASLEMLVIFVFSGKTAVDGGKYVLTSVDVKTDVPFRSALCSAPDLAGMPLNPSQEICRSAESPRMRPESISFRMQPSCPLMLLSAPAFKVFTSAL